MPAVRREGAALLVAGYGHDRAGSTDASMVHTLGQIGESLLATGAPWHIRRLRAEAGDRLGADRGTLKRQLDELIVEDVRAIVLVVLGAIVELPAGPALVTGADVQTYPEDATLPLAWIAERLRAARAERVLVLVSAQRAPGTVADPARWLAALATGRTNDVIAVDAPTHGCPLADALLLGVCGDALDPRTGTVTLRSLSEHLARCVPGAALQASMASETVATSPPLAGLWDVRRSQLATRTRATGEPEDLAGTVLPGRFRIDALVARGTFGTVYRARQLAVERDVAVKVLHAEIDPASEDGRLFVHEIRSVGRIDHANVVRIHQADITHDGRLFFAMELLDGRDLQQLVADGPVPPARAVELTRALLAGLGAAHDAGLVHADVKPANAIVVPVVGDADRAERVVLVDFGLSRLRPPDRPAESAGGTPAFMAPEQLRDGRVDARSDLFSAALVLVYLLTGWRRLDAFTLVPPAETLAPIAEPLRAIVARALAIGPAKRYQSAREFAAALAGTLASAAGSGATPAPPNLPALPFRHLAPLTELDRDRFFGREHDLAVLIDHVLYGRSVVYTAPSGTGKTSLLRAGLVPRLESLGVHVVYHRCRTEPADRLAAAIAPGTTTLATAIAQHRGERGGKLVLVLDQLEAALGEGEPDLLGAILARDPDADVTVVLSIREDHLARLVARTQTLEPMPIVRLPPLRPEGARAAIVGPLAEARLAIEPELATVLLDDLQRAAAALGGEMGWAGEPAVYPPHLQLACSVLYEALGPGEATLTLAHYRELGGFAAIVGEYLERVLETELADGRDVIARDLFVALVTAAHERATRPESELLELVGATHGVPEVAGVLEALRARGLLVRVRTGGGEPRWELVHDSLVPRVLAWVDRKDLDRRRAVELVRYHVKRSRLDAPSLLGRAELREIRAHAHAIAELDAEWRARDPDGDAAPDGQRPWTPTRLVARSRRALRRKTITTASIFVIAAAIASASLVRSRAASAREARDQSLRERDLGRFTLVLEPFDWNPETRVATPVARTALPGLVWALHYPHPDDPDRAGEPFAPEHVVRGPGDRVEAHGGRAFLVVTGRGAGERCAPSIIPLRAVPGYAQRGRPEITLRVRVPTCAASRVDTVEIPRGPFIYGGLGEPPSAYLASDPEGIVPEQRIDLPAFRCDRTEVTNAAFAIFGAMAEFTGITSPTYPNTLPTANGSDHPVAGITWTEARAYCRYVGKELPTTQQWQKVLRGGALVDDLANPAPRRNLPWITPEVPVPANIWVEDSTTSHPIRSFARDRSPYGVYDLAGSVQEWTDTPSDDGRMRMARGGYWSVSGSGRTGDVTADSLVDYMAIENQRPAAMRSYGLGMRCVEPL